MGSSLSGTLAILFMDKLERKTLTLYQPHIEIYKRYIDDICVQTIDEVQADNFHTTMNTPHLNFRFEIEKPVTTSTGKSLSLLEFTVTISDDKTEFEFYKKKAKKTFLYTTDLPFLGIPKPISSATKEELTNVVHYHRLRPNTIMFSKTYYAFTNARNI